MEITINSILPFRTETYARAIYLYGTNRLTTRDGFPGIADGYYIPVETYSAGKYSLTQINLAYSNGWLNETEYNETVVLMPV